MIDEIKELQVSPPAPEFNDTLNLSSTTDDVISPILNDQTTEMFDAIADRLATIGDQCLSAIPVQSGLGSEELTDVERELVAWVRRSGDRIDDRIPPVVMDALLRDGLRHIINRFTTEVPMVGQLYLAFRLTSVVVNGGVNSNAVRQVA